jgi:transcriptional regulator with XRE-family HTH domain
MVIVTIRHPQKQLKKRMDDCRLLLAKNMKKFRKILGLSQMALAEKVGCSTTLIGNIEITRRFPSADNINRIANALGVKIPDLFTEPESAAHSEISSRQELKIRLEHNVIKAITETLKMTE